MEMKKRLPAAALSPLGKMMTRILAEFTAALLLSVGKLPGGGISPFGVACIAASAAVHSHIPQLTVLATRRLPQPISRRFAAAGDWEHLTHRLAPICVFGGTLLGYRGAGLRYPLAGLLALLSVFLLRETAFSQARWFPGAAAGLSLLLTGVLTLAAGWSLRTGLSGLLEVLLGAAAAICYTLLLRAMLLPQPDAGETGELSGWLMQRKQARMQTGMRLGAGALVYSLVLLFGHTAPLFSMRIGAILALICLLTLSAGGPALCCTAGWLLGLALETAPAGGLFWAGAYGGLGLLLGLLRRRSPFLRAFALTLGNALLIPWMQRLDFSPLSAMLEVFASGVVYLTFSPQITAWSAKSFPAAEESAPPGESVVAKETLQHRLRGLTRAFETLSQSIMPEPVQAADPMETYRDALIRTCGDCPRRIRCWEKESDATRTAIRAAASPMEKRGEALAEDFPPYFAGRCMRLPGLLESMGQSAAAFRLRQRYRRRMLAKMQPPEAGYRGMTRLLEELEEDVGRLPVRLPRQSRELERRAKEAGLPVSEVLLCRNALGRYSCRMVMGLPLRQAEHAKTLAELASGVSGKTMVAIREEEGMVFLREQEAFRISVGSASRGKTGSRVSGDGNRCFRTEEGQLILLLADGCGSGEEAAVQSDAMLRLMEDFLQAGVRPETALGLIGPAFTLRCQEESFTSVDLLQADLYDGSLRFYKCGAAPSYIRTESGPVQRVVSHALPAGMQAPGCSTADMAGVRLQESATVVLISDGVADAENDGWLTRMLDAAMTPPDADGATVSLELPPVQSVPRSAGELATAILNEALRRGGGDDDMTVMVCRFLRRTA